MSENDGDKLNGKKVWNFKPILIITAAAIAAFVGVGLMWDYRAALCELAAGAALEIYLYLRLSGVKRDIRSIVLSTMESVGEENRQSLITFPMPVVITGQTGDVLWYNDLFRDEVLGGEEKTGMDVRSFSRNINLHAFDRQGSAIDVNVGASRFTVFGVPSSRGFYILYWVENTELKNIADEYHDSRPVVAAVLVDNYDELMQNAREGEKGELSNQIEKTLLAWVSQSSGFIFHSDRDRYIFVFEERHLRKYVESRFDVLDRMRTIVAGERMPATLSIGIGRGGRSFAECDDMARQALDMALGRGGDQAAVKSPSGFEFYGGTSKAVEKRTKVKTRIIASALTELIDGSENVLIMGHRGVDLDSLGSSVGIYRAVLSRGRTAKIVMGAQNAFVQQTVAMLRENGYADAFCDLSDAMQEVTRRTLLIIVDTHRKGYIEFPELYEAVRTIVVIDHHRKMVDFIDNAVIFYHEPYASSTSEMVSELVQYVSDSAIGPLEAGMLMAGMALDTRNFTVRTGVRTFEAAAYLRRKGADTAKVRQMFSGSMENYIKRARLVASAEGYRGCAIAIYNGQPDAAMKVVAPQAADELLTITGVSASFVLFQDGEKVAVSARSMGAVNVQLIMEKLGGGGHLAMAGAQVPSRSTAEVREQLEAAIDEYFKESR